MIFLRLVESVEFRHLSHNRLVPDFLACDVSDDFVSDGFLLRRVIEDRGAILRADIGALTIQSRRIVDRKEDFEQFLERDHLRIELDLHDLGVACFSRAYLFIRRIGHSAARIARNDFLDAAQIVVDRFQAPETSPRQCRDFILPGRVHLFFPSFCRALGICGVLALVLFLLIGRLFLGALLRMRLHAIAMGKSHRLIDRDSKAECGEDRNCDERCEQNRFHKITSLSFSFWDAIRRPLAPTPSQLLWESDGKEEILMVYRNGARFIITPASSISHPQSVSLPRWCCSPWASGGRSLRSSICAWRQRPSSIRIRRGALSGRARQPGRA